MRRRTWLAATAAAGTVAVTRGAKAFIADGNRRTFVFSGGQPVPVLDPHQKYDYSTRMMQQSIYDGLLKYVGNPPKIVPWLAKSWDLSPDGLTYTFHLVDNATFHNGDPVDAEAVRFSYERGIKLDKAVAWMLKDHLDPAAIKAVDPHTVTMTLKQPFPGFIAFVPWWYIVNPKEVMANVKNNDYGQEYLTAHEAGSGPFKINRWDPQAAMVLDAVPDYWRGWEEGDANRPSGLIFQVIREPAPRREALLHGSADMITDMSPDDYDALAKIPGIRVTDNAGMTPFTIMFNTAWGPTADVNLRRAIAYAMDYDALIAIENGHATLMDSPFPPALQGHVAVADMPRKNLDMAKTLLAKTPYAKGGLTLDYLYVAGLEVERQVGLTVLASLEPLGIKVNVQGVPWPTVLARGGKAENGPAMIAVYVTPVSTDPDGVAAQYASTAAGSYWGMHHLADPALDKMIADARVEMDPAKRMAMYAEIQNRIVSLQPAIFGMLENRRWAMKDNVQGFVFCPIRGTGEVDFYPIWVKA
jgi:peptide/nickel transport system substrate-binding protein